MACVSINESLTTAESHPYRIALPPYRGWKNELRFVASRWLKTDEAQGTFTLTAYVESERFPNSKSATVIAFSDAATALAFRLRFT